MIKIEIPLAVVTERPAVAGAPVQLQQQTGTSWTKLSSTTTDAGGGFTFSGTLQPGTYRVQIRWAKPTGEKKEAGYGQSPDVIAEGLPDKYNSNSTS